MHAPGMMSFLAAMRGRDGCWNWPKYRNADGYGLTKLDGKTTVAPRVAYALTHGAPGDLFVLHRCDNPACVNPDHLFLGTARSNALDAKAKDRHSRGERNGQAKLTDEAVREIRRSHLTQWKLADKFGVRQGVISAVKLRQRWAHVQD